MLCANRELVPAVSCSDPLAPGALALGCADTSEVEALAWAAFLAASSTLPEMDVQASGASLAPSWLNAEAILHCAAALPCSVIPPTDAQLACLHDGCPYLMIESLNAE